MLASDCTAAVPLREIADDDGQGADGAPPVLGERIEQRHVTDALRR